MFFAIYSIFSKSYSFVIDNIFYHSLIGIESRVSAFEFEKYDLSESPFRESVEYDVVTPFACEYHIFWSIREIRKRW